MDYHLHYNLQLKVSQWFLFKSSTNYVMIVETNVVLGANIVIAARTQSTLDQARDKILQKVKSSSQTVHTISVDLCSPEKVSYYLLHLRSHNVETMFSSLVSLVIVTTNKPPGRRRNSCPPCHTRYPYLLRRRHKYSTRFPCRY